MAKHRVLAGVFAALALGAAQPGAGAAAPAAAALKVVPQRLDPYKNFKFLLHWEGRLVAGFAREDPLIAPADIVRHREGGDPSTSLKSPGAAAKYEPIALESGVSEDAGFAAWAGKTARLGARKGDVPANLRKEVVLEIASDAAQPARERIFRRCWASQFQSRPEINRQAPGVVIQAITLQCQA